MMPVFPALKPLRASEEQLRAVYTVMRLLADDDRARGNDSESYCEACRRNRASAGSINYGGMCLCNGCATDYEVLRIDGRVLDVQGYLNRA